MSRWICTKGCRALGRNFNKYDITEYAANPSSGNFEAYSGDKILRVNRGARTDLDNTYYFPQPGWTDKSFALTRDKQGQTDKPDYDFTNRGLLFPNGDATEFVQIIDQMDHSKMFGTELRMHVHFIQTTEDLPIFKMDYKFWNNGGEVPAADITLSTADGGGPAFEFDTNPIMQIISFPHIPAPVDERASAHLEFDFYRDDAVVAGDVLTKYVDYHYKFDSVGSGREFCK